MARTEVRPWVAIRGIYGGVPEELMANGATLGDAGVNAVWVGSDSVTEELCARLKAQGAKVFAEFNTLHVAAYLEGHPEAAPVGTDGTACPPPDGWQGVSPTHQGYRRYRMHAFRKLLRDHAVDGVWLDYHHAHASWEQAEPTMPESGFDPVSLEAFTSRTGIELPKASTPQIARTILSSHRAAWAEFWCGVLTDWVREFRSIIDEERPGTLLGSFHCPWSDVDHGGALRNRLFIDLASQARYLDVFSPMTYHARFGHAGEPQWISGQTAWLGRHLGLSGNPGERHRIWPIVQLADWGEPVASEQIETILEHGTRRPATGVLIFHWSGVRSRPERVREMTRYYGAIRG